MAKAPGGSTLLIMVIATLLMAPAFWYGHVNGHSSFLNVAWSEGFSQQLFAGHLYPRWLPEMSEGAGSPAFYFYAPLPFYLAAPAHLIVSPRMAVVFAYWLMLALSGLSFHLLARAFVGTVPALAASLIYMAMPYHLLADIWTRAAIGEQAAFIFVPLCLLCAYRLHQSAGYTFGLAASFAGLLLSHLPSALAFSPFLVGFCLWTAWRANSMWVVLRAFSAATLAGGLAAAYLLPALFLQGMIRPEYWGVNLPRDYFLLDGNTQPFMRFLDTYVVAMGAVVGVASVAIPLATRDRQTLPWAAMALVVLFLTSALSWWVWAISPALDLIQFPWRTLTFFEVAACMLLALALDAGLPRAGMLMRLMLVVAVLVTGKCMLGRGVAGADPILMFRTPAVEDERIAAGADAAEYLPYCRTPQSSDVVVEGTSQKIVEASLPKAGPGVLPVFYYPFLTVRVDGNEVDIACDPSTGFIKAELPLGANPKVEATALNVERIGYAITLASLALLAGGYLFFAARERRQFKPA